MKMKTVCIRPSLAGSLLTLLIACATAPKSTPAAAPAKASVPAPDDLRAQATALRKKAFDFGLKDVPPDDYTSAEAAYSAGAAAYGVDNTASAASFQDAKTKFGDVIQRGLPILVAAEKGRASKLRDMAMQKTASSLFPDLLAFHRPRLPRLA